MDSSTALAVGGDGMRWGLTEQLLAAVVDGINIGNWQRTGDRKARRPKPIPRPGVTDGRRTFKAKRSYTIAEMRKIQENWGR